VNVCSRQSALAAVVLSLAVILPRSVEAQSPAESAIEAADHLKRLQSSSVAHATQQRARAYHFGSQGAGSVFSNHTSHSNRLIPFYTFGRTIDPDAVTGVNSIYRDPERLKALYGFLPANTVNPEANYADQSDFGPLLSTAVKKGAKHLFIVWFDGLDWPTTQAAAVAKTGKIYTTGKGFGLAFQDENAGGSARFGYYVTAPTHDLNAPDLDAQTVSIPRSSITGGYDPLIAGPDPWTLGPLAAKASGYLKGQSANPTDRAGVSATGRLLHAYTDSAPSAAEFVSGKKAYNNGINVLDNGQFAPTIFHRLQGQGWKVGTVTSVPFDHASPAAMYAHNVHRDDYQDLAREMLGLPSIGQTSGRETAHPGLDVVIGTGFGQVASEKGLKAQGKNASRGNLYITDADRAAIDVRNGGRYVVAQTEPGTDGSKTLAAAAGRAIAGGHRLFGFFGS
jgi:alkaline phosphatase